MKINDKWKLEEVYQLTGELFNLYMLIYIRLNNSNGSNVSLEVRAVLLNFYEVDE